MSPRVPNGSAGLEPSAGPVALPGGTMLPVACMLKPLSMAAEPRLTDGSWLTAASSTAFSRCSRLFENGKTGRRPLASRLNTPMKVLGRSSWLTNLRADSNAKARVSGFRSFKMRQTTFTVRSGFDRWARGFGRRGARRGRLCLRCLLRVFGPDFAARDQPERPHVLADAI